MRNRTLSDLILAITLGLCVAAVAGERRNHAEAGVQANSAPGEDVADGARAVAAAMLWDAGAESPADSTRASSEAVPNAAERALDRAAAAAGEAASSVEMPFISFGSATE